MWGKSALAAAVIRVSVTISQVKNSFVHMQLLKAEITLKAQRRNNFPCGKEILEEAECLPLLPDILQTTSVFKVE